MFFKKIIKVKLRMLWWISHAPSWGWFVQNFRFLGRVVRVLMMGVCTRWNWEGMWFSSVTKGDLETWYKTTSFYCYEGNDFGPRWTNQKPSTPAPELQSPGCLWWAILSFWPKHEYQLLTSVLASVLFTSRLTRRNN